MGMFCWRWLMVLAVLLSGAGAARAELAPYLDSIGWDEIGADARFSHLTTSGGAGQSVAVLDTGIDPEHVMFDNGLGGNRVVAGENFVSGDLARIAPPDYADGNRHGTFVSSVAGGNQGSFTVGDSGMTLDGQTYAAGEQVELGGVGPSVGLVPVRVLGNRGSGSFEQVLDGLNWVIDHHDDHEIRVVNLSLGTSNTFVEAEDLLQQDALAQEIAEAVDTLNAQGVPVVAAAGNTNDPEGLAFPAILDNVISVGASRRNPDNLEQEQVADFTNRSDRLDLMAPGEDVVGAFGRDYPDEELLERTDWLGIADGTSFAAPQVAGAITLINEVFEDRWGRRPTYEELFDFITFSETDIVDEQNDLTFPRLDLMASLDRAYTIPEPTTAALLGAVGVLLLQRRSRGG